MANEVIPRHYIFGVIAMMLFITGGVFIMSAFKDTNAAFDSENRLDEFNRTFNKLDDLNARINQSAEDITTAEPDLGVLGVLNSLIQTGWLTLKTIITSFTFMSDVYGGLTALFGIPAWIPLIIGLFITTMLVFAIFSMVFQKDG